MIIKEFRVILPFTVEEYQIGQLWSIAQASRGETGGGDGVEILANEKFENFPLLGDQFATGQFTKKKYYLSNKVSGIVRTLLPKSALILEENAWNAYPYCRTIITNEYMGTDFGITIESYHLPGRGDIDNAHQLPPDKLAKREVVIVDISGDLSDNTPQDVDPSEDPRTYKSSKCGRGPLLPGWIDKAQPVMTCYKLVTCHFNWFGLQSRVEKLIQRYELKIFSKFHRKLFCWTDEWYGLTMEDIRKLEDEIQEELALQRAHGEVRGSTMD